MSEHEALLATIKETRYVRLLLTALWMVKGLARRRHRFTKMAVHGGFKLS